MVLPESKYEWVVIRSLDRSGFCRVRFLQKYAKVCENVKRIVVEGFKMQTVACKALTVLFI